MRRLNEPDPELSPASDKGRAYLSLNNRLQSLRREASPSFIKDYQGSRPAGPHWSAFRERDQSQRIILSPRPCDKHPKFGAARPSPYSASPLFHSPRSHKRTPASPRAAPSPCKQLPHIAAAFGSGAMEEKLLKVNVQKDWSNRVANPSLADRLTGPINHFRDRLDTGGPPNEGCAFITILDNF